MCIETKNGDVLGPWVDTPSPVPTDTFRLKVFDSSSLFSSSSSPNRLLSTLSRSHSHTLTLSHTLSHSHTLLPIALCFSPSHQINLLIPTYADPFLVSLPSSRCNVFPPFTVAGCLCLPEGRKAQDLKISLALWRVRPKHAPATRIRPSCFSQGRQGFSFKRVF